MRNKLSSSLWKIATAALLTVMLVGGVVCVTDVKGTDAYAATYGTGEEIELEDADYKIVKYSSISRTKDTATGLYKDVPQYTDPNGAEWLFAGWYYDEELTQHVPRSETEATDVYAKFVSADILTVKCQTSTSTTPDSPNTVLRCVSSVDSLMYNRIGFDIIQPDAEGNLDYENIPEKSDNKVGVRIYAKTAEDAYTYSPKVVDTESEYFFSTTITIDDSAFGYRHLIKPYWITKDGTKVYGVSRYVTVNEGFYKDIIHATIKMEEEPEETNNYTTDVTGATVTYIDHDGIYAHFEISVSDRTALKSLTKFVISDANGELGAYYYRNLLTSYTGSNADDSWYTAYVDEGNVIEDEFVVATSADLYGMKAAIDATSTTNGAFIGKTIYLVSDIAANSVAVTDNTDGTKEYDWTIGSKHSWTPLASDDHRFAGVFDGQGHTIKGLYVKGKEYQGLFAATGTQATVQNFNLKDSYMSADNSGTSAYVGSVAGRGNGTIKDIYSDATVECVGNLCGGLVGCSSELTTYENCNFAGALTMAEDSQSGGGIVGYTGGTEATNIVSIKGCIFSGIITGSGSTSTKKVRIGGICGYSYNKSLIVENCISVGTITTNLKSKDGHVGNIVGTKKGNATMTTYALSISNTYILNNDLMQVGSVASVTGATEYSQSVDLKWYDVSPGGCVISDADDLYGVHLLSLAKGNLAGEILRLGDDIELTVAEGTSNWTPIPEFAGTLDGNGHTISGIHVVATDNYAGVFAKVSGATIKNLRMEDSSFTGSKNYIGAIAGNGYGTFEKIHITSTVSVNITGSGAAGILAYAQYGESSFKQCWNAGSVTVSGSSKAYAGGLVGRADDNVKIENCLNSGAIDGNVKSAGGFIGWMYSGTGHEIRNSVNTGTIEADSQTGALIGYIGNASVTIQRCYNKSNISAPFDKGEAAELTYTNGELEKDYINVTDLSTEPFTYLDDSVWKKQEGIVPTLKCFE